jgi:hypothetical protein
MVVTGMVSRGSQPGCCAMTADGLCVTEDGYRRLLGAAFNNIRTHVREDLSFVPYSFLIGIAGPGGKLNTRVHERPGNGTMRIED